MGIKKERAEYLVSPDQLKREDIDRFYIGNEFCEFLLPSPEFLKAVLKTPNKNFSLVIPPITSLAIEKIKPLLNEFAKGNSKEVIVNDFGTLHILNEEYPDFEPVIGRFLAFQQLYTGYITGVDDIQPEELFVEEIDALIEDYKIKRIELNNSFFKIFQYTNLFNKKFKGSLHYPEVFLNWTLHNCAMQNWDKPKFTYCNKPCLAYTVVLNYDKKFCRLKEFDGNMFLKGKVKFIKINNLDNLNQEWIDRIVINPLYK